VKVTDAAQRRWVLIVLAGASIAAIGMGLRQVMGLYMKPITMDLGIGRQTFSLAIAIANIVWGLAAPFVGAVSDRYGAGRVAVMGALATATGLYLTYAASSEASLLLAGVFLGLGVAGAGVRGGWAVCCAGGVAGGEICARTGPVDMTAHAPAIAHLSHAGITEPRSFRAAVSSPVLAVQTGRRTHAMKPVLRYFAKAESEEDSIEELVVAAGMLATQRIGAIIVIERQIGLRNYVEGGIPLDARMTYDLLVSIFQPTSPLHDGAVIVQEDRIAAAACFLPLTVNPRLAKELGSRHRAAIGLTEENDAVAIVVSEETGALSLASDGAIERPLTVGQLRDRLQTLVLRRSRMRSLLTAETVR